MPLQESFIQERDIGYLIGVMSIVTIQKQSRLLLIRKIILITGYMQ